MAKRRADGEGCVRQRLDGRWEGYTPKQTAELLGVSYGAVDDALMRMREAASIDDQIDRLDQLGVPLPVTERLASEVRYAVESARDPS